MGAEPAVAEAPLLIPGYLGSHDRTHGGQTILLALAAAHGVAEDPAPAVSSS